jgi:hypothetical protein
MKFNKGDRVRVMSDDFHSKMVGRIGTVKGRTSAGVLCLEMDERTVRSIFHGCGGICQEGLGYYRGDEDVVKLSTSERKSSKKIIPACPFDLVSDPNVVNIKNEWFVVCCECQAQGPHKATRAEAIRAWSKLKVLEANRAM